MTNLQLIAEQGLPDDISADDYTLWFQASIISNGVRMGLPLSEITDNKEENLKKVYAVFHSESMLVNHDYNAKGPSAFVNHSTVYNPMIMEPENLIEYVKMQKQIQFTEIICFLGGDPNLHSVIGIHKIPDIVWCGAKVPQPIFDILATFCETQRIQPDSIIANHPEGDNIICLQWSPEIPKTFIGCDIAKEGSDYSIRSEYQPRPTQSEYKKDDMDNIIINGKLSIKQLHDLAKQEGIEDRNLFFSVKNKVTGQSFGTHEIVDFGKGWTKNTAIMHLTWEDLPQQDAAQG